MAQPANAAAPLPLARPSRRARVILAVIIAAALLVLGLVFVLRRAKSHAPAPAETTDVPRRAGDAIEITSEFRERAGIQTSAVTRAPLIPVITAVGVASFDPTHVAAVGTRATGIVTKVVHVEGDVVEKGDLLAEIEAPGLAEAQADMHVAQAKHRAATKNAERERSLLERRLTTAREYEQAEAVLAEQSARAKAARERVDALGGGGAMGRSQLRAPVAGVIAERSIAPGQSVGEGLVAFRVGDVAKLWVLLRVFEKHLDLVREDDVVEVRRVSDSREVVEGKVAHVGAVLDEATRTADVRVTVSSDDPSLRPGQAVEATIHASGSARVALALPKSALTFVDGAPTVFVAETPLRFSPRSVELGIDAGERVEVKSGIREGEAVVVASVLALKSELFR